MSWRGHLYVDTIFPFGLWTAPKVFLEVADSLQGILIQKSDQYNALLR